MKEEEVEIVLRTEAYYTASSGERDSSHNDRKSQERSRDTEESNLKRFEDNYKKFPEIKVEGDDEGLLQRIKIAKGELKNVNSYLMNSCIMSPNKNQQRILQSSDGAFVYRLGIIDFLTAYGTKKKVETRLNNMISWKDKQGASCQEPAIYADRFIKFL